MKQSIEFKEYLYAEIKCIKKYAKRHPELTKDEAAALWVKKYAVKYHENWYKN